MSDDGIRRMSVWMQKIAVVSSHLGFPLTEIHWRPLDDERDPKKAESSTHTAFRLTKISTLEVAIYKDSSWTENAAEVIFVEANKYWNNRLCCVLKCCRSCGTDKRHRIRNRSKLLYTIAQYDTKTGGRVPTSSTSSVLTADAWSGTTRDMLCLAPGSLLNRVCAVRFLLVARSAIIINFKARSWPLIEGCAARPAWDAVGPWCRPFHVF